VWGGDKFSADKTIFQLVGWLMKEMLEANIPIHFSLPTNQQCQQLPEKIPHQCKESCRKIQRVYGATIVY